MTSSLDYCTEDILEEMKKPEFTNLHKKFTWFVDEVKNHGPTNKLWVQFFKMTTLLKQFVQAEKSGDWTLHLQTVRDPKNKVK